MSPASKFRRVVACEGLLLVSPAVPHFLGYPNWAATLGAFAFLGMFAAFLAPFLIRCRQCRTSLATTLAEWRYGSGDGFWEQSPWALPDPPVCVRCKTSLWEP
jgi:hypothetical protein